MELISSKFEDMDRLKANVQSPLYCGTSSFSSVEDCAVAGANHWKRCS